MWNFEVVLGGTFRQPVVSITTHYSWEWTQRSPHTEVAQSCWWQCCSSSLNFACVGWFFSESHYGIIWTNLSSWLIQFNPEIRPVKEKKKSPTSGEKSFEFVTWFSMWLKTCDMWWSAASAFPASDPCASTKMLHEDKWKEMSLK